MSKELVIYLPEKMEVGYITTVIRKLNSFYRYDNAQLPRFYLSLRNVRNIDVLGVLVLYKFLEYSVLNNCFLNPTTIDIDIINDQVKEYGFESLISSCYNDSKKMEEEYRRLRPKLFSDKTNRFLVSPIIIFTGLENREKIEKDCFESITNFYGEGDISDMVFMVMSELIGNFYSHSDDKSRSIIVAYGTQDYVEIACADAGIGIVESLKGVGRSTDNLRLMRSAFEKGVSSKPSSDHMGYGLWMIDETVKRNAGHMVVYSENAFYERRSEKSNCLEAPQWRGTIVYLRLNTHRAVNVKDIVPKNNSRLIFI